MTETSRAARSASIRDVARLAGVSIGTVSNAINHPHRVAPETRARIVQAIDSLHFVPNARARNLASGRTVTVGLLMTDLANSYFVDIARGAEGAAHLSGYSPLIGNADNSEAKETTILESFAAEQFAGVLLAPYEPHIPVAHLRRRHRPPTVVVNVEVPTPLACSVASDDVLGGYLAARHLIDLGHRHLLFTTSASPLAPIEERRRGAEKAVAEAADVRLDVWTVEKVSVEDGYALAARLRALPARERPTGVVAPSDLLAMGVVNGIKDSLSVPGELSVIGYDNDAAARDARVPLTTISQDGLAIGREAMGMLDEEIRAGADGEPHEHRAVRVPPHLIDRASTALAPFSLD